MASRTKRRIGRAPKPRRLKTILTLILPGIVAVVCLSVFLYSRLSYRPGEEITVTIDKGMSLAAIAKRLEEQGVIRSSKSFVAFALSKKAAAKLRAGEFKIRKGEKPEKVLEILVSGRMVPRSITVPEGYSLWQVANLIEHEGIDTRAVCDALIGEKKFVKSLGLPAASLEGYLFPDTYYYTKGEGAKALFTRMVERFFSVYDQRMKKRAEEIKMTMHQVVTLASIVEKETGQAFERPMIAAVFHNRLKKKMRLQSDPTVIYGIGAAFNGNLTKKDLRTKTAYNTYKIKGLPPGPIASPGKDALEAALWPADSTALYFVARNDGTHVFSTQYRDHVNAVNRYQKRSRSK